MVTEQRPRQQRVIIIATFLTLFLWCGIALAQTPVIFGVAGDTGERGKAQREVAARMKTYRDTKGRFDTVLLLGDNVYPDGVGEGLVRHFEEPFKGLLDDGVRFFAVLGNHDISKGTNLQINYPKFNMGGQRFYSFKLGGDLIEFFALDSTPLTKEAELLVRSNVKRLERLNNMAQRRREAMLRSAVVASDSPSLRNLESAVSRREALIASSNSFIAAQEATFTAEVPWLEKALRDSTATWKVVLLHHAIYSSANKNGGHGNDSGVKRLRALLEPILLAGKVNIVFGGHDHVMEQVKPQGPAGGHKVYYVTEGASSKLRKGDLDKTSPFHEFGEDRKYSFLVVRVTATEMNIEAVDSKGNVFRTFVIPHL